MPRKQKARLIHNTLASRAPQRSLSEACRLAGLPEPGTSTEIIETYFRLLIAGIDYSYVGAPWWVDTLLIGAPPEPARPEGNAL